MSDLTKADLHSHTYYSLLKVPRLKGIHFFQDSALSPKLLIKLAHRKKLNAIALTDHNNMNGVKPFLHYASKYKDLIPIIGQEVTKYDHKKRGWAHILVYGLNRIPWDIRFKPLPEFLEYLDDSNGLYILAHPFDLSQSAPAGGYNSKTYDINASVLKRIGMVEIINGFQPKRHNYLAQIISREFSLPGIAGGDSHQPNMVGRCYTYVEGSTEGEILEYLHRVKKSPSKYQLKIKGTGSTNKIWEDWFHYLFVNLDYNIQYDIHRHLNPDSKNRIKNPVYDYLYYNTPMLSKILVRAAIPYIHTALQAGLKIWVPRMRRQTLKKELKILHSLVNFHGRHEHKIPLPLELPYKEDDLTLL